MILPRDLIEVRLTMSELRILPGALLSIERIQDMVLGVVFRHGDHLGGAEVCKAPRNPQSGIRAMAVMLFQHANTSTARLEGSCQISETAQA